MSGHRRGRGQALVESALGLLVTVTVLIFGIHFAEVGYLSLKSQEAANFAVWDATARRMHDVERDDWALYRGAVSASERAARRRYGGRRVDQVFTRSAPMEITCSSDPGVQGVSPQDAVGTTIYGHGYGAGFGVSNHSFSLAGAMRVGGAQGIACTADAPLTGFRIPSSFLDGAPFKQRHYRHRSTPLSACAPSRNCGGRLVVLLDDWALATTAEGRECPLSRDRPGACRNRAYYSWAQRVFDQGGLGTIDGRAGSRMHEVITARPSPIDESQFFMSFRGSESDYTEDVGATHAGSQSRWETTPFAWPETLPYDVDRTGFWLGKEP